MNCKHCGAEIVEGANFCMKCGMEVGREKFCQNCGQKLPEDAMFCLACGNKIEEKVLRDFKVEEETYPNVMFWDYEEDINKFGCQTETLGGSR